MTTRAHVHQESLPATPEQVFTLLITPSAIRAWWSAARAIVLPEPGGLWAAAWGDDEDPQDGFPVSPEADAYYAGCQKGWSDTFAGIRRFLQARPAGRTTAPPR